MAISNSGYFQKTQNKKVSNWGDLVFTFTSDYDIIKMGSALSYIFVYKKENQLAFNQLADE